MTHVQDPPLDGTPVPTRHTRAPEATATRYSSASDATATRLALAARDGDPVKADRFVRVLHRDVWRYVAHLSADTQAADDLTQDVFLRALTGLPRFEGRSSARTWLLSIARRTVADSFRHAAARPRLADRDDWQRAAEQAQPCGTPGFEEGVALAELLSSIPADRREAFVLTQLLGIPYAEAATVIGCPVGTVRSRVARARVELIGLLTDVPPEPGVLTRSGGQQPVRPFPAARIPTEQRYRSASDMIEVPG
ncbi:MULTISPECIES: sigma-70 family RNA polymerase sigma factor [Streptomyces]|uniref:RNA polymerase sigma factor n=1 Tax=Streptomyces glycanivorans TaxID=3033808 RepID=A0ABY9J3G9_9ACTN|nr:MULTISPECIES: sigma-70 family RNA polymerase sigma factor [unclassified Streptomyces]WSQ75880.1 sigma-70 family RNA polymerase sigma factor [Streptomyces sp. NBC_01213]TXS15445.1 sigma-70 family RNA polymerase sigma factor [Streptomyces sp. wa22]WLQ62373.1 sigma-70 family RNA polymerase sigma factor [Streptomyces sp. Alt3]WSQ83127.1 sigma-70 family RNA polymerase sigma factor [Streptomyces sp. NBC_01212]WSR10843.1 sigma-70 family RNA polymerase sigma factor [Streptomyces sp. NBC_01208]